ncbi:MAG TPA: YIP1 family protein [Planctomycetota bacterium]
MIFHCPHCGLKAASGKSDCGGCGRPMARSCPACAEQVAVTATACKYCGEEISPLREAARARTPAAEDIRFLEAPVVSPACAWEDRSKGLLRRWWGTWGQSNFAPKAFFRGLKPDGGHAWPVGFAFGLTAQFLALLVLAMIAGVGLLEVYGVDFKPLARQMTEQGVPTSAPELAKAVRWSPAAVAAVGIPTAFLGVTLALYVSSFLWHGLLKLLGGRGTFQSTLRVVGYGSGAAAWLLIPFAGAVMAPLMNMALYYHGFREMHGLSRFRAAFAVLLPVLVVGGLAAWALLSGHGCCDVRYDPF